ncbi:MAG: SCO family protein [Deltaproteobacteria bacterium]|nr:SCO family protein [Deltaproteobacteria bacterium]
MKKLILYCLLIFSLACSNSKLPVKGEFPDMTLISQDGKEFTFSKLEGKVIVVSYIYTNCPDICHIISAKLNAFKNKLKENGIQDKVYFVSISLDPERDTPEVLKQHAKMMNLDLTNWVFVTGDENSIDSTIKVAGMEAIKGPIEYSENGEPSYEIAHQNRISLVDEKGRIRKHYRGTTFDMEELLGDIKILL